MKKQVLTLLITTAAAALTVSAAQAQDLASLGGPELTPIVLHPGKIEIRVPLAIGLNSGFGGKPISLPVDIYYGVNDQLTVGLSHSDGVVQAVSPYPAGKGLCLSGTPYCSKAYDNVGLDAIYRFMAPTIQLAFHGGLEFESFDPSAFALRLGVLFQAPLATNVALMADPRLIILLSGRDSYSYKEYLSVPIGVQFWVNPQLRLAARTEIAGDLENFSDTYRGSLGVFAGFTITPVVEGFASFDFTDLYGKNGGGDFRQLVVGANIKL